MKKIVLIITIMAATVLPMMAQFGQQEPVQGVSAPNSSFQSTSTMVSSGSTYSTMPTLNADGTVSTPTQAASPAQAPGSGPRKIGPTHGEGNPNPVGDAVLPLLLAAAVYCTVCVYRRKRRV